MSDSDIGNEKLFNENNNNTPNITKEDRRRIYNQNYYKKHPDKVIEGVKRYQSKNGNSYQRLKENIKSLENRIENLESLILGIYYFLGDNYGDEFNNFVNEYRNQE